MDKICSKCGSAMKLVPAGVSQKTGKPYSSFWSCNSGDRSHSESAATQPLTNLEPTPGPIAQPNRPLAKSDDQLREEARKNEEDKMLVIARESAAKTIASLGATSFPTDYTLVEMVEDIITQSEKLVDYFYNGVSEEEPQF